MAEPEAIELDYYDHAVQYWSTKGAYTQAEGWATIPDGGFGYLFSYLGRGRNGYISYIDSTDQWKIGCPLMIASLAFQAEDPLLTSAVLADKNVYPATNWDDVRDHGGFTLELLQSLARLQRLADKVLERPAPQLTEAEIYWIKSSSEIQ